MIDYVSPTSCIVGELNLVTTRRTFGLYCRGETPKSSVRPRQVSSDDASPHPVSTTYVSNVQMHRRRREQFTNREVAFNHQGPYISKILTLHASGVGGATSSSRFFSLMRKTNRVFVDLVARGAIRTCMRRTSGRYKLVKCSTSSSPITFTGRNETRVRYRTSRSRVETSKEDSSFGMHLF